MSKILNTFFSFVLASFFIVLIVSKTDAQNIEIGANVGLSNYIGDLAPTPVITETKPACGIYTRINMSSTWAWTNGFTFAQVSGNDKNFDFNKNRNLNFRSNIYELASTFEFNYLKYGVGVLDNRFTSYLFAGFAVFGFEPQGQYNGNWYNLRAIQTEGPGNGYQTFSYAVPFGIGIKWILNRSFNFECQFGFRKTYTDYLDDVSKTYSDISQQIKKGQVSAVLSDPSILNNGGTFTNKNGYKRGNSDFNDWYMILNVGLSYRIYRKVKCSRFY